MGLVVAGAQRLPALMKPATSLRHFRIDGSCRSVFNRGADGDLRAGEQLLHGLRHHMRRVMADDVERVGRFTGHDFQSAIRKQRAVQVDHFAVEFRGQRGLGQALADGFGDVIARHRGRKGQRLAVGQCDLAFFL